MDESYWMTTHFNCSQNLPSTRSWSFFARSLEKVGTWKRKFPQCLRRSVTALYVYLLCMYLHFNAIFHCSRFARAGETTNFNHVKNKSRVHAKKVECSSTFMACPRAFRRTKNAQVRQLERKLSNVRSARAGKANVVEAGLNCHHVPSQCAKEKP
jgi:hypothetical protein